MAGSATQSAAEDEEDLVLLQRQQQQRHAAASSGLSISSVDRFLRDNGFDVDDDDDDRDGDDGGGDSGPIDDDVLSSTTDGDHDHDHDHIVGQILAEEIVLVEPTSGVVARERGGGHRRRGDSGHAAAADEGDDDVDDELLSSSDAADEDEHADETRGSRHRRRAASPPAAGEEDRPTPRFILLEDDDLLSVGDTATRPRPPVPGEATPPPRLSFDRSLLLGGSGLSALSSRDGDVAPPAPPVVIPSSTPVATVAAVVATTTAPPKTARTTPPRSPSPLPSSSRPPPVAPSVDDIVTRRDRAAGIRTDFRSRHCIAEASKDDRTSSRSPDSLSTGSARDDELSEALGIGSSLSSSHTSSPASSRLPQTRGQAVNRITASTPQVPEVEKTRTSALPGRYRHPAPDDEEKVNAPELPAPESNPWIRDIPSNDTSTPATVKKTPWTDLNILLRKNALPVLPLREIHTITRAQGDQLETILIPEAAAMVDLVHDFVLQLEHKNQVIQDLVLDSNRSSKVQSRAESDLATIETKTEDTRYALRSAQAEVRQLQERLRKEKEDYERQLKSLKAASLKYQQQLKVSEHRVKAKEVLVERMQKKLQQQVDKENINKARDRRVFKRLQQRDPRRANAKDNQSLECINLYETQREQLEEEIDNLRGHVASLNSELRDKENFISHQLSASHSSSKMNDEDSLRGSHSEVRVREVVFSDEVLERLESARREQEQAAKKLRQRESVMMNKINAIEAELLEAREEIADLKEANTNLTMEAESRPSIRDYRLAQRRIHQLERQLSEHKLALEEANDINELRRYMGTKDLIERDRLNHRLHLNRLNTLPRETLLEVVKEVCRVLNLTDITLVTPSLHKLCNVVTAVPRMEKFIRDICGFVYFHIGDDDNNQDHTGSFELEKVLPTLQQWMSDRKRMHELEGFKAAIISELCKRTVEPVTTEQGATAPASLLKLPRAVSVVSELVELEKNILHHREIYMQASEEIERRPSVLINQIIRHFSNLFGVKSVDGVLPKINEVYLYVNESDNFLKSIRKLLNLGPGTSVTTCLDAIRVCLEKETPERPASPQSRDDDNFVVDKARGVAGVRQVREMTLLVRDLKKELGAASIHEILPRTRRLMELLSLSIHSSPMD